MTTLTPPGPRRPVLGAAFLLTAVGFLGLGLPDAAPGISWPSLRDDLGAGRGGLGWILAMLGVGYLVSSLSAGRLVARLGLNTLLVASWLLVAAGLAATAMAPAWPLVLSAAAVTGLGSGAIDTGLNAYAAIAFRARQVNWLHAAFGAGAACGPLIVTAAIVGADSWRGGYSTLALLMAVLAAFFLTRRRGWGLLPAPTGATAEGASLAVVLRRPAALLQVALFFVYTGVEVALGQWSYTLLHEHRGLTEAAAGLAVAGYWGGLTAGRLVLGGIVDLVGPDRLLRCSTATAATAGVIFAWGPGWSAVPALVVAGATLAPIFPTLMAQTPARVGDRALVHVVGIQTSAAMLGVATVPALAGVAASALGIAWAGFVTAGAALGVVVLHECLVRAAPGRQA